MNLKKSPLVEMWISFRFEPAAGTPVWTRERYKTFLNAVASTHPKTEEMSRQGFEVVSEKGKKLRQVEQVLAVRAFSENDLRVVQLTPDVLAVNYTCGGAEPYPGFEKLLDEAMNHHRDYLKCYRPPGVAEVAVHYVDLVDLPVPENRVLRSEEYFTIDFRVPEAVFGTFSGFEVTATVVPPGTRTPVEFVFSTSPGKADDPNRRFHLEWHSAGRTESRMVEPKEVKASLQAAHDRIQTCFRHAFTPKGWSLFEPVGEA